VGHHLPAAPTELPRIRSERPAFELHYPHLVERLRTEAHTGRRSHPAAADMTGQHALPGSTTDRDSPSR
jgi:cytochrome c oxidase subunit 1